MMKSDEILRAMTSRTGWSTEELAELLGSDSETVGLELESLLRTGGVHRSPRGRWWVERAAKPARASAGGEWGRRTRILIYSPEILAACPEFTRNTFLHFVEDEDHGFRLRDYVEGRRIEVREVNGITSSKGLAAAFPRYELEFDDEEEVTALTDNAFWEKRIAAHNEANRVMLQRATRKPAASGGAKGSADTR